MSSKMRPKCFRNIYSPPLFHPSNCSFLTVGLGLYLWYVILYLYYASGVANMYNRQSSEWLNSMENMGPAADRLSFYMRRNSVFLRWIIYRWPQYIYSFINRLLILLKSHYVLRVLQGVDYIGTISHDIYSKSLLKYGKLLLEKYCSEKYSKNFPDIRSYWKMFLYMYLYIKFVKW